MVLDFKVSLLIRKRPLEQPVHFKEDGGRFELQRTVKLNVNTKYSMEFTFRPPQILEAVTVAGAGVTPNRRQFDDELSVFKADLITTGMDKDKKGSRHQVPVVLQLKGVGELKVNLQCKLYPESEVQHSCWGAVCNNIELECKRHEASSFVDVVSTSYR
ncbi:hypothetical protein CAPTEDRAFT_221104 [Capitella teleta]|uniref:CB1 cannabinoid receptor-interacting protein 1 n=1 Tax=Capitella teleta TaxID=283909 RepID=R7VCP4_CAPTE|nr:hypothetical protein CAPTEDRAFT_221104 [Capitella teleta]|eukprot:ELU16327.1 hypothetical protein CAPTEDRAFT_221104 [Capitella teleta]